MAADIVLYSTLEYCIAKFPETRHFNQWLENWATNMEQDAKFADYLKKRNPGSVGV